MQSENLHIDEFIRQKEAEWTPDHSQLDVHWEKMTSMLVKPASPGPTKRILTSRRIFRYLGGFAIVTVITIITYTAIKSKKNSAARAKVFANKTAIAPVQRLPQKNYAPRVAAKVPLPTSITSNSSTPVLNTDRSIKPIDISSGMIAGAKESTVSVPLPAPDAAALLNDFYKKIEKAGQEFFIQADRDTLLVAKEGTRMTIPANAFVKQSGKNKIGVVKIVLTEYYKYDDMAAAKLNTTSNGRQLVTGGMVNIRAFADGEELKVAPKKNIELAMPTRNYDKNMQMFTGEIMGAQDLVARRERLTGDTMAIEGAQSNAGVRINWVLAGGPESPMVNERSKYIDVLDLSIDPHRVTYGANTKAKFLVSRDIDLSNEEIKEELRKRYGNYYDKIKIRRVSRHNRYSYIDSTAMPFETALRLKLVSKEDSIRARRGEFGINTDKIVFNFARDSATTGSQSKIFDTVKYYRFTTSLLGWINCDRFANNNNNILFALNLGEGYEAGHFYSQLIFTRYRSIMNGYSAGWGANKILFGAIPANEPVQLITVGVKDGKVVSCIQLLTTSKQEVSNLMFEETTPEQFRKRLESLDLIR